MTLEMIGKSAHQICNSGQAYVQATKEVHHQVVDSLEYSAGHEIIAQHGFFWLWRNKWCDRHLCHVTGSDHV